MMTDTVSLVKKDGRRKEGVGAVVQPKEIITFDVTLDVEEGDRIERPLPTGRIESYLILDTGFNPGHSGIPPFYQMKVRKESAIHEGGASGMVVYNVTGPNARVNVNSSDSSTNVANVSSTELFVKIRDAAQAEVKNEAERRLLVERVEAMEASYGSREFAKRYSDFIALAANHMSVFAPFMPALGQLLGS
jgi:hypothetical protein